MVDDTVMIMDDRIHTHSTFKTLSCGRNFVYHRGSSDGQYCVLKWS